MKNIIEIDAASDGICELVSSIYDGSNRLIIKVKSGNGKKLIVQKTEIEITSSEFLHEVPVSLYTGKDKFNFMISDSSNHKEKVFQVKKVAKIQGDLIIKQIADDIFEFRTKEKPGTGEAPGDRIRIYGVTKEWDEDIWVG